MTEVVFKLLDKIGLYITHDATLDTARLLYVNTRSSRQDDFSLSNAWQAAGNGVFCFLPHLPQKTLYQSFVKIINELYIQHNSHFLLWIADPDRLEAKGNIRSLKLVRPTGSNYNTYNTQNFQHDYALRNSTMRIDKFCQCNLNNDQSGLSITSGIDTPKLIRKTASGEPSSKFNVAVASVDLAFSIEAQGTMTFDVDLDGAHLNVLDVSLRYFLKPDDGGGAASSVRYPVFDLADNAEASFHVQFDPLDPTRTRYTFNAASPTLGSHFRTSLGRHIGLKPNTAAPETSPQRARLVFTGKPGGNTGDEYESVYLTPAGDFQLSTDTASKRAELLCGLSGTETLSFAPGADTLRFDPGKPAYACHYPFESVSPLGPPVDLSAPLLEDEYTTSWVSLISADGAPQRFNVQPKGAALYGRLTKSADILEVCESGFPLPQVETLSFPLVPYAGVVAAGQAQLLSSLETQVIARARQQAIEDQPPVSAAKAQARVCTTAAGMIVATKANGSWAQVKLGQKLNPNLEIKFTELQPELQRAFQSNHLFVVIANAQKLGALVNSLDTGDKPSNAFYKTMRIEDWQLDIDVGENSRYDDYRNVLILKFRPGSLVELVQNPELWGHKEAFAPVGESGDGKSQPDPGQLLILSQWLQNYLDQARSQENPLFDNFQRIIADPNWTGVLALKVTVSELPENLAGLLAGMDRSRFHAHHFGIDMNMIDGKTIDLTEDSATFGLIDYVDPAYTPPEGAAKPRSVAPEAGAAYDFKVLVLRALFENATVKSFESVAQLTLNQLFGQPVVSNPDNPYNTVVLQGSYQHQDGKDLYVLDTTDENLFRFNSNVLNKVEIVKVQFQTVSRNQSRFSLWGYLDFKVISQQAEDGSENPVELDVFSFGNPSDEDASRQGLRFSNLAIEIDGNAETSADKFIFDTSRIAFDPRQSTPRDGSLYQNFALELDGLVQGDANTTLQSLGYLPVSTDFPLSGVVGQWYGLRFRLNMGSPGELAGTVDFTSHLLLAWSPGPAGSTNYQAQIALKLPGTSGGAKVLSLQGVMQLSIGDLRLLRSEGKAGKPGAFIMVLSEVALKFLGLLKMPPNGSTAFYLFGDPRAQGQPSKLGWYAVYNQNKPKASGE